MLLFGVEPYKKVNSDRKNSVAAFILQHENYIIPSSAESPNSDLEMTWRCYVYFKDGEKTCFQKHTTEV